MRRFFILCGLISVFVMLSFSASSFAGIDFEYNKEVLLQPDIILFEGFEDGVMPPPSGWYLEELNQNSGWFIGDQYVYNGSYCGWINFDNTHEKDNWLISPDLDLTYYSSLLLSFWGKSDTDYPGATVEIHVKGNGFDDVVWDLIGDETWDYFDWYNVNLNLSSYVGKIINLSWRYVGKGGESFGLDDICLIGKVSGSDLVCTGSLVWNRVKSGDTVDGNFEVSNSGVEGSNLNWRIAEYPDWGIWTFDPLNGVNLRPEDGSVMVEVSVITPDIKNTEFTGHIKLINMDNPSDFEIIQISLTTPLSKPYFAILSERLPRFFGFFYSILLGK